MRHYVAVVVVLLGAAFARGQTLVEFVGGAATHTANIDGNTSQTVSYVNNLRTIGSYETIALSKLVAEFSGVAGTEVAVDGTTFAGTVASSTGLLRGIWTGAQRSAVNSDSTLTLYSLISSIKTNTAATPYATVLGNIRTGTDYIPAMATSVADHLPSIDTKLDDTNGMLAYLTESVDNIGITVGTFYSLLNNIKQNVGFIYSTEVTMDGRLVSLVTGQTSTNAKLDTVNTNLGTTNSRLNTANTTLSSIDSRILAGNALLSDYLPSMDAHLAALEAATAHDYTDLLTKISGNTDPIPAMASETSEIRSLTENGWTDWRAWRGDGEAYPHMSWDEFAARMTGEGEGPTPGTPATFVPRDGYEVASERGSAVGGLVSGVHLPSLGAAPSDETPTWSYTVPFSTWSSMIGGPAIADRTFTADFSVVAPYRWAVRGLLWCVCSITGILWIYREFQRG